MDLSEAKQVCKNLNFKLIDISERASKEFGQNSIYYTSLMEAFTMSNNISQYLDSIQVLVNTGLGPKT